MNLRLLAVLVIGLIASLAHARVIGPVGDELERSPNPAAGPVMSLPGIADGNVSTLNPLKVLSDAGDTVSRSGGGGGGKAGDGLSVAINIMVVLTVISLAPSIVLMTTCFMRILIVLGVVKQALGAGSVPPPQVITALALFSTFVVMAPTIDRINAEAVVPYRAGEVRDYDELWRRARQPMRDFMFDQIDATGNWSSVYMILSRRGVDVSEPEKLTREDVDMLTLVPAYMLSELKVAFLLGFKVYLPFLVIDMVVSTMLISMGMMMLPPVMVSLPFKILLFVLVDGWTLVVGGLMRSFVQPGELAAVWPPGVIGGVVSMAERALAVIAC
ncbi:MAG: flagellar type III secretion system pore protein FliP [Planctomycetota bacterium]|nr:flagellar type III secretion system pore protein FliP [Planctomycetota bacterium]